MTEGARSVPIGTGMSVPERVVTNEELAARLSLDTTDEWIASRTGIRTRRVLEENRQPGELAVEAARRALEDAGIEARALDVIVCATVTADHGMPGIAPLVQHALGARCAAFDVGAACAGFVYALGVADAMLRAGPQVRALVIGVDALTRTLDWADRATAVLFGDGAGALVLERRIGEGGPAGILSTHLYSDGGHARALWVPAGPGRGQPTAASIAARDHVLQMNGKVVYAHAVRNVSHACGVALEHNGLAPSQVDCVIAHQANRRILEAVAERTGIPIERFFVNIDRYGNTSAASIPIALDEARRARRVGPGSVVLIAALGAGLVWGSAVVRL